MRRATKQALLALSLLLSAPAAPAMEKALVFQDWAVACDNTRHCDAVGYQRAAPNEPLVMMRLSIDAGADATLEMELLALGEPRDHRSVRVMIDGQGYIGVGDGVLGAGMAQRLLRALKRQTTLRLWNDEMEWHLSLDGLPEALQTIDEVQGRSGTVAALYNLGPGLPDRVPAALPAPVLRAALVPPRSHDDDLLLPAILPELHEADCDDGALAEEDGRMHEIHRLSGKQLLVLLECQRGKQQSYYAAWIVNAQPPYAPVRQRPVDLNGVTRALLLQGDFDRGRLSALSQPRWPVDCGTYTEWLWTDDGFQLAEVNDNPLCRGFPGEVTQRLWTTTVR